MFSVYYRTPRDEALHVLFLVEQDPARLTRLRELYTGRHDVLDALWWRLHPRQASPRGVPDPVLERDGFQRQAFSREGEAAPILEQRDLVTGADLRLTADEHRLRELDAQLAEDARALDAAVGHFGADFPAGEAVGAAGPGAADTVASTSTGSGYGYGYLAPPAPTTASSPAAAPGATNSRRRRLRIALAIGLAALLAVNVVLATRLDQVSRRLDSLSQQSLADPRASGNELDASSASALQVFTRAQTISDVYPVQVPIAYDLRDVRRLTPEVRSGAFGLYAVLANPGEVCLIAVLPDLSSSSSCSAVVDFAENGLVVTSTQLIGGDDRHAMVREITWRPNGTIVLATSS